MRENRSEIGGNGIRNSPTPWRKLLVTPVFLFYVFLALYGCEEGERSSTTGKSLAPDFKLNLLSGGDSFRLSDHKGKPVVINFFASWCTTCGVEASDLEKVYQAFAKRNVMFVGVGIDDTEIKARQFLTKSGITYPSGLDEMKTIKKSYGIRGLPYTFFVDKNGFISYIHAGAVTEMLLKFELEKLL